MTTTTDKQKYIKTWESHINQLALLDIPLIDATDSEDTVALDTEGNYYGEIVLIRARLKELVQLAAHIDFPTTETKEVA